MARKKPTEPTEPTQKLDAAEARWRLLATDEVPAPPPAPTERAEEPEADTGTRWPHIVDRDALPIRPESKKMEIARYVTRQSAWEARQAIVEAPRDAEVHAADLDHLRLCRVWPCPDETHVAAMGVRAWKEATHEDLQHLGSCVLLPLSDPPALAERIEDCPELHRSHLLPPKPLTSMTEFCCERRCYPAPSLNAWSSCLSLQAHVRRRREAERRCNPDLAKQLGHTTGFVEPVVARSRHLSEGTEWGLYHAVYDPASRALRGE